MTDPHSQDQDLDDLLAAGAARSECLGTCFERHRERLERMVEMRLDPALRQRVSAADVLQEAYLEISRRLAVYLDDPRMPFFLWIRFIVAQRMLKLYRFHVGAQKRDVRRQVARLAGPFPGATSVAMVNGLAASGLSPSGVVVRGERRSTLEAALDQMNPVDREMLVLRHYEALSNGEAASELGLSKDAASKRYIRALDRLRKLLGPQA